MFLRFLLPLLLLFLFELLHSQETVISGRVTDEAGEAVIGANVFLQGGYDGASTDETGSFTFTTPDRDSQVLVVSYLGYASVERPLWLDGKPLKVDIQLAPSANELAAVVISAGAFEASDEKKSVILRPLDIVTTAGATADLAAALQTLPGTQRVGEDGRLFVRGGAAYETRTFVDGLYVANPYTSSVPNLPVRNRFTPFLFKGTMFSTGGYSAEYGQALSSALILETQDLAPETVTSLSLMSVGLGASHTQRWKKTSLSLSADYTDLTPYQFLVPQNIEWRRAPYGSSGQLIFRHQPAVGAILKVQASYSGGGMGLTTPDPNQLNDLLAVKLNNSYVFGNASYQAPLGDRWSYFVGAGYAHNRDNIYTTATIQDANTTYLAKTRFNYEWQTGQLLRFGAEHWREKNTYDLSVGQYEERNRHNDAYSAAFVEADWSLGNNLAARTGLRAEYSTALDMAALSPRLSLAYRTGKHSQASVAVGRFVQTPEIEWLYQSKSLDFERADHYLLNWQWQHNERTLRAEVYHKQYADLVTTSEGIGNDGDGYARGFDLFYRDRRSLRYSDFWVSYSWLDTRRRYADFSQRVTPFYASKHNASLVYKYWVTKWNCLLGFTAAYGSPRPYDDPNTPAPNDGRTTAFRDLSFNASYLTQLFGNFTIIYLSATNLPGFDNTFGQQFSRQPDAEGQFQSVTVRPPAKRFLFLGVFISLGQTLNENT